MSTKLRIWKKQEKRIVKLLYKKGFLETFKLSKLYWEEFHPLHRKKKRIKNGIKYGGNVYAPEIHYSTVDYWGECDEHSLVAYIIDLLYWENAIENTVTEDSFGYPDSDFKFKGRLWFINYLESLPTKRTDSKINKLLYLCYE